MAHINSPAEREHLLSPSYESLTDVNMHTKRIWPLLLTLSLSNLATRLFYVSLNRLIEARYCNEYYKVHNPSQIDHGLVSEHLCKVDEVQMKLGALQGMLETILVICGRTSPPT